MMIYKWMPCINLDYSTNVKNQREMNYTSLVLFYNVNGEQIGYQSRSNPNGVVRTHYYDKYYVFNTYADYTNLFNDKHYVKAMVGFNQENAQYNWVAAERRNLVINSIPFMTLASGERFASDGLDEYAIRGAFTRLNYIFNDRYLIEFNGRYDGTSKFGKKDRFAFFPSVSLGWRIESERFFGTLANSVDLLKLRVS